MLLLPATLFAPLFIIMASSAPVVQDPPQTPPPATADESAAAEESEVIAILRAADDATKAVDSVRYHADFRGIAALGGVAPVVEADVIKQRSDENPAIVFIRGEGWAFDPRSDSSSTEKFISIYDGERILRLDLGNQLAFYNRGAGGEAQTLGPSRFANMREFGHPTPFQDELNANVQELEGRTMVGDVLCDVVYIEYDIEPAQSARWYFGAEDHLPRRVERYELVNGGQLGATALTLTNLEIDPEIEEGAFDTGIPEGYSRRGVGGPVPSAQPMNVGGQRRDGGQQDGDD